MCVRACTCACWARWPLLNIIFSVLQMKNSRFRVTWPSSQGSTEGCVPAFHGRKTEARESKWAAVRGVGWCWCWANHSGTELHPQPPKNMMFRWKEISIQRKYKCLCYRRWANCLFAIKAFPENLDCLKYWDSKNKIWSKGNWATF